MQLPSVPSAHSSRAAFRPRAPQPCRMQRAAAAAAVGLLGAASLHRGRSRPGRRDGQQQAAQESASRQPTKTSSSSAANTSAAREPAGMVGWGASQLLEFGLSAARMGQFASSPEECAAALRAHSTRVAVLKSVSGAGCVASGRRCRVAAAVAVRRPRASACGLGTATWRAHPPGGGWAGGAVRHGPPAATAAPPRLCHELVKDQLQVWTL